MHFDKAEDWGAEDMDMLVLQSKVDILAAQEAHVLDRRIARRRHSTWYFSGGTGAGDEAISAGVAVVTSFFV